MNDHYKSPNKNTAPASGSTSPDRGRAPVARRKTAVVKHSEPHSALDVLQAMLEKGNSALAQDFKRYRLKLDWVKLVGPVIGEKCSPVAFSNGLLHIWVTNSTWMNQLFFARRELLKKVNGYAGYNWVREIRFTQDKKDVPLGAECLEDRPPCPEPSSQNEGGAPPNDPSSR